MFWLVPFCLLKIHSAYVWGRPRWVIVILYFIDTLCKPLHLTSIKAGKFHPLYISFTTSYSNSYLQHKAKGWWYPWQISFIFLAPCLLEYKFSLSNLWQQITEFQSLLIMSKLLDGSQDPLIETICGIKSCPLILCYPVYPGHYITLHCSEHSHKKIYATNLQLINKKATFFHMLPGIETLSMM